jgi:hypothetical protein
VSAPVRRSGRAALLAAALIAAAPDAARACAVCFAADDDGGRVAYLATTVFMSALPLGMIGGLVWWLYRRARERQSPSARSTSMAASSRNR